MSQVNSKLFEIQDNIPVNSTAKGNSVVQIKNCYFTAMINHLFSEKMFLFITTSLFTTLQIINSTFIDINNIIIIDSRDMAVMHVHKKKPPLIIKNTIFMSISSHYPLISLSNQILLLEGPVLFRGVQLTENSSLFHLLHVGIYINTYIEISNCSAAAVFPYNAIYFALKQPATVNFTKNNISSFINFNFFNDKQALCYFQFFSDYNLDLKFKESTELNFSIIFNANQWATPLNSSNLKINHCVWLPGSAFNTTLPSDVNHWMITFINESFITVNKSLCYCSDKDHIDCLTDELGPIYPGQMLNIMLAYPTGPGFTPLIMEVYDLLMPATACKVSILQEVNQIVGQTCTQINFTIVQTNDYYKWCELSFNLPFVPDDAYYIKFYECPAGFSKLEGRCQCDPILKSTLLSAIIDICDINDQTIQRPANSWISAVTNNNSHTYLISLNCPFDYCLPHSSHLKLLLTSDLQCQFRRSNVLCGQCSDGLSTVFGSSHCQQCSDANLYTIVPIALSGILLVVLLFILNLTVVDGTINAFILYVNIVSINSTVFFPSHDTVTRITFAFVSLANLDLGIEMCFYNGMDDYAKMWLQLLYPFYLVLIAALLIIASRYSRKIQRLTTHRALPVLATLFLLSYTKILRTVSSVLFSYSTIIQLPSGHNTLVWSVDANVNILGVKFIVLSIVCSIFFLSLIPFNMILLFTRTLSRFRIVNYFKPLLDVYQAPYKDKSYYWTGLHLVIKALFFGISALDNSINFTISIFILFIIGGSVGYICPFKNRLQNCHEMILLFNLHTMFVLVFSGQNTAVVNIMITLAAIHFSIIVTYHIFSYALGVALKSRLQLFILFLFTKMTKKLHKKSSKTNAVTIYSSEIPEKAYDYSKYQEPLVEDYI